ncbi:MAG: HD domain-containing protein [Candidatus Wallbacteria bacterium]|nr:HD domain-containing protein [Candidatus Wallbacteria bacterium]
MNILKMTEQVAAELDAKLSAERKRHSIQCAVMAADLALKFRGVHPDRAYLAGLGHDILRDLSEKETLLTAQGLGAGKLIKRFAGWGHELIHAPLGAIYLRARYCVPADVFNAIEFHSTGSPRPGRLLLILMISDFCEPGREYPEAARLRSRISGPGFTKEALSFMAREVLKYKLEYLLNRNKPVCPASVGAYNYLCRITGITQ